jgi:serine/threonine protein kinase
VLSSVELEQLRLGWPPQDVRMFGRYQLIEPLGRGGMATVSLGRLDGPGGFRKWAALKVMNREFLAEQDAQRMFLDEARTAARIDHPNVAQVFDLGEQDGTLWIAMEYLHGESLRAVLEEAIHQGKSPLPPALAAHIILGAAEGLHAAHELRGGDGELLCCVHRDVSPHNIFVTYDGSVKVVDFGIAKVADRSVATRTGVVKGKLAYMSPEQSLTRAVDRRTDIFALGIVLWELLTCRRLFRAATETETFERLRSGHVDPPSSVVRGIPAGLDEIVLRALQQDPERRFPTARAMAGALHELLRETDRSYPPEALASFLHGLFPLRIRERDARLLDASGPGAQPSLARKQQLARDGDPTASLRPSGDAPSPSALSPSPSALSPTASLPGPSGAPPPMAPAPSGEETAPIEAPQASLTVFVADAPGAPAEVPSPGAPAEVPSPGTPAGVPPGALPAATPALSSPRGLSFAPVAVLVALGALAGALASALLRPVSTPSASPALAPLTPEALDPGHSAPATPRPAASGTLNQGFLSVDCSPGCLRVLVNGVQVGASPIVRLPVLPGTLEIQGEGPQGKRRGFSIKVAEGKTASVRLLVD